MVHLGSRLEAFLMSSCTKTVPETKCTWNPRIIRAILTVLLLLAVTWGFLQSLDDQRGGGGHHGDGSLSVLNGQADGDLQTLPVGGGLGDVITNFFGRLWGYFCISTGR